MMDSQTKISDLKEKIKQFSEERDWDQFHGVKELAIGIITEASELLAHFRFKSEKEIEEMFKNENKRNEISEELADTLGFVLRLAQKYNIDLTTEFDKKLESYAVERCIDSPLTFEEKS